MSNEDKVHTTIVLTLITIFILLIGVLIGKSIYGEIQITDLILGIIWGILFIPLSYIAIVCFIIKAAVDEERRK